MRLSYYGGGHYDSIVGPNHNNTVLTTMPGEAERTRIEWSKARAALSDVDETKAQSDLAAMESAELEAALHASREQFNMQADDLERIFSDQLDQVVAQADLDRTTEELLQTVVAQSALEADELHGLAAVQRSEDAELEEALKLSKATAEDADREWGGDGADDLARAMALSQQSAPHTSGSSEQDELARALALSADVAAVGLPAGDDIEVALAMSMASADQDYDEDLQRVLEASRFA